jgi:glycosyltransferase involved in cell wall biosynthesis
MHTRLATEHVRVRGEDMTRVALIHEWFTALAGSEKVVEQLCSLYPEADLFAVYADPDIVAQTNYLKGRRLRTSFIERLPRAARSFRAYLSLMPLAVEQFDLSEYDVVISSSHAVAKGVLTGPDQLHISYVHTPIRYAWDLQHQYLRESGLATGVKGWIARSILHKLRIWDYRTSAGVNHFIANSQYISRRIRKVYGRPSEVIYPPVDVHEFGCIEKKDSYYLAAARFVPYKRMDVIAEAFKLMPHRKLIIIGDGPERDKVRLFASPNIEFLEPQPLDRLKALMQHARAFVFAAEEDFGITPVEAQACGTPVIAFGKGGALETVRPLGQPQPTGLFFDHQDAASLVTAVDRFEANRERFEPRSCSDNAQRFSVPRFREQFASFVSNRLDEFSRRDTAWPIPA